jgi:CRP/FNR family transcriptional regulator, cyclic AMP receptor protein
VRSDSFLGELDPDSTRALLASGSRRDVVARATVLHEGDEANGAYVVLSGRLKASSWHADGREQLLNAHGPGDVFGLVGAIDGGTRSASVISVERSALLFVARPRLFELFNAHPAIAIAAMRQLARDFRTSNRRQLALGGLDTLGRVARQLADLADAFGEAVDGGMRITIPVTHQDLANWVGASREGAGRAVSQLERLGHVASPKRRCIVVRNPGALASFGD